MALLWSFAYVASILSQQNKTSSAAAFGKIFQCVRVEDFLDSSEVFQNINYKPIVCISLSSEPLEDLQSWPNRMLNFYTSTFEVWVL